MSGPAVLALLAMFPLVLPQAFVSRGLSAAPPGAEDAAFDLIEQERKLVLLPLENDTREESLDYLSEGLIRILGGKVESIGYVRATDPARLLIVTPTGGAVPTSRQANTRPKRMRALPLIA